MNRGFYISQLIIKGINAEDALVEFSPDVHAIIGPSNTGKTYIFQCLKFMLGSTKIPKKIKESNNYDSCYLEIILPDKTKKTIFRSLAGGDATLYECSVEEVADYIVEPEMLIVGRKETKKNKTLQSYFLELSNLKDKKVRRNKGGVTDNFVFSFLRHLTVIDEVSIIKEESPIFTGQYGEDSKERSILRFLLTGKDDSNIASKPKQKVIDNRKGRIEVIEYLINDYEQELSEFSDVSTSEEELKTQNEKLKASILAGNKALSLLYEEGKALDTTVDKHWNLWKENESRLLTINELQSRFRLLREHYRNDTSRLEAIIETSTAFSELKIGHCPVCNSELVDGPHTGCSTDDIDNIVDASNAEIKKISYLELELKDTVESLKAEKSELQDKIKINRENHVNTQRVSSEFSSVKIQREVNNLDKLRRKIRENDRALKIINKLDDLKEQKSHLEKEIDPMDGDYSFNELTTATTTELCKVVKELLKSWSYEDISSVSFSEDTCDLIINGYDRSLSGKGYRALAYSAFVIGIMHICLRENRHSGVVLLDSPLCTLRSKHFDKVVNIDDNDVIGDETKEAFYSSLSTFTNKGQIIILDNDGPVNPNKLDIGYTEFTKDTSQGRYGFYSASSLVS